MCLCVCVCLSVCVFHSTDFFRLFKHFLCHLIEKLPESVLVLVFNNHINVNLYYLSNEINPGFVAIAVLELQAKTF